MASILLFVVCFGLLVYKAYKYMFNKPPNFPPGPPRLPLLGTYLFQLLVNYRHLHLATDWLCKFYKTNVLGIFIGSYMAVVVNDAETIKEAMFNQKLDGRPDIFLSQLREPSFVTRGIFFTQNLYWRDQRRFTLRYLRDFGFGRRFNEVELDTEDELRQLIELIKGGPKYPHEEKLFKDGMVISPDIFYCMSMNVFLKIFCNDGVPRENQGKILQLADETFTFLKYSDSYGRILSVIPWIVKYFPTLTGYNKLRESSQRQYEFMKELIDEQYATYDENHERHFLDVYFKQMKAKKSERNQNFQHADFGYEQLVMTYVDFLMGALSAIPIAVGLLFRQLVLNPETKKRVHDEIDRVVGRSRLPTLNDRSQMHYTEAAIRESFRYETLLPSGVSRLALEPTTVGQYDIPQNCVIFTGLRTGHLDTKIWSEPDKFLPERFLDAKGRLDLKKDKSVPFGAGKRLCAGETHARHLTFLITAAILQNFDISIPTPYDEKVVRTGFIKIVPKTYVKFIPR